MYIFQLQDHTDCIRKREGKSSPHIQTSYTVSGSIASKVQRTSNKNINCPNVNEDTTYFNVYCHSIMQPLDLIILTGDQLNHLQSGPKKARTLRVLFIHNHILLKSALKEV